MIGAQTEWDTLMNRPFLRMPDNNAHTELQCPSISTLWSEQLMKMLTSKPHGMINTPYSMQEVKDISPQSSIKQKPEPDVFPQGEAHPQSIINANVILPGKLAESSVLPPDQFQSEGQLNNDVAATNQNSNLQTQPIEAEFANIQYSTQMDFTSYNPIICPSPSGSFRNPGALFNQDLWEPPQQFNNNAKCVSQSNLLAPLPHQEMSNLQYSLKDLSDDNNNQSDIYSCLNLDGSNSGSTVIDPSVSSTILDEFCTLKNVDFPNPSDYLVGNFCSTQDVQSSLADSHTFSIQEYADNSGGASSSNVDFDDNNLLPQTSFQQVTPRFRTYTKVQTHSF